MNYQAKFLFFYFYFRTVFDPYFTFSYLLSTLYDNL